jgi:hypothetical protein
MPQLRGNEPILGLNITIIIFTDEDYVVPLGGGAGNLCDHLLLLGKRIG